MRRAQVLADGERSRLTVEWSFDRFHMYLYGVVFTLVTHHKSLEGTCSTSSRNSTRIERRPNQASTETEPMTFDS